jgi:hypothetical protein
MEGALPIIFLAVVLKIPVLFAIWLIWWAVRDEPRLEEASDDAGDHGFRRWRSQPRRPRGPRRGPHGGGARALPECPPSGRGRTMTPGRPLPALAAHEQREHPTRS